MGADLSCEKLLTFKRLYNENVVIYYLYNKFFGLNFFLIKKLV